MPMHPDTVLSAQELTEAREEIRKLRHQVAMLRGAMDAQDERERKAGERCGVPYVAAGCDWPDSVADAYEAAREDTERLDWLTEHFVCISCSSKVGHPPHHWIVDLADTDLEPGTGPTLRAAIDAARGKK